MWWLQLLSYQFPSSRPIAGNLKFPDSLFCLATRLHVPANCPVTFQQAAGCYESLLVMSHACKKDDF